MICRSWLLKRANKLHAKKLEGEKAKINFGRLLSHFAHRADLCLSVIWRELFTTIWREHELSRLYQDSNHELIMRRPRFTLQSASGGEFRVKGFK